MRCLLRVGTALVCLALFACRDDGPPTSASPFPTASPASESAAGTSGRAFGPLVGTVVNAVTGAPVSGASVRVGEASFETGPEGLFRTDAIGASGTGTGSSVLVVVEAPGYFRRETHMRPSIGTVPPVPVVLEILPEGNDFDLEFFDHVFRDAGAAGTHPWVTEPTFEIWQRVFRCSAFVGENPCDELTALDARAPESFGQMVRTVVADDARRYSDGHVVGTRITTRLHSPGTVVSRDNFIERGKVVFALVTRDDNFSWAFWRFLGDDAMVGGHIHLNRKHIDLRGVYSHELAHTLGFSHPLGLDRVPRDSIMRRDHGDGPTRLDLLHSRILYHRPPGSRTPDVDPPGFLLNTSREASYSGGGETTRWAR